MSDLDITLHQNISEIPCEDWDACLLYKDERISDPFTTHRFLLALETSESVGEKTGWHPAHLVARAGKKTSDEIVAVMPTYIKTHSQGEYIFDHDWAMAYEQAGGSYYPKLQAAVPFTPVAGRRICAKAGYEDAARVALIAAARRLAQANGLSSFHMTFCAGEEYAAGAGLGLMQRQSQQFHWLNNDYKDFDDFLSALSSNKRKNIRKERRTAQGFGGQIHLLTGEAITDAHWDAFWRFYQDTGSRKWGRPYLTRDFFTEAQQNLRDDILLVMAESNGHWCAGALHFIGADCLYGRYWGEANYHPCLHFELCYYQAIDWAIAHRLARIEAGAQGAHKLARGYVPRTTHSLHWFADTDFGAAVQRYLRAERRLVQKDQNTLAKHAPFRKDG